MEKKNDPEIFSFMIPSFLSIWFCSQSNKKPSQFKQEKFVLQMFRLQCKMKKIL